MGWYLAMTTIEPEDDFGQRLRKSTGTLIFFPGSFVLLGFLVDALLRTQTDASWFFMTTCTALLSGFLMVQYALIRQRRYVSDLHAAAIPWALLLGLAQSFLVDPEYDNKSNAIICGMLGVLLQAPKIALFFPVCFIMASIHDWNWAHIEHPEQMIVLEGALLDKDPIDRFLGGIVGSVLVSLTVYNFYLQVEESERRGRQQVAANEMTLEILECQRRYNTVAIAEILAKNVAEGVVDAELLKLYDNMNSNLENYRPFLPNYLFQETESEGDEAEEDEEEGDEEDVDKKENKKRISEVSQVQLISESAIDTRSNSVYSGLSLHSHRQSLRREPAALTGGGAYKSLNHRGPLYLGRITFALVDICAARLTSDNAVSNVAKILKAVADSIYSIAKETKASVHSMLGDTVQLTWNATNNVVLPETKGAVFLARLAKQLQERRGLQRLTSRLSSINSPNAPEPERNLPTSLEGSENPAILTPLALSAAIGSGKATVHNITTSCQQVMIIEAPWLSSLEGSFALAKHVGSTTSQGCVLLDDRTMKGSELEVETCPVEQVTYSPEESPVFLGQYFSGGGGRALGVSGGVRGPSAPRLEEGGAAPKTSTLVHQLLHEMVRADDEWMYQLQGGGRDEAPSGASGGPMENHHTTMGCNSGSRTSTSTPSTASVKGLHRKRILSAADGDFVAAQAALDEAVRCNVMLVGAARVSGEGSVEVDPQFAKAFGHRCQSELSK